MISQCSCGDVVGRCGCIQREVTGLNHRVKLLEAQLLEANKVIGFYSKDKPMVTDKTKTAREYMQKFEVKL